MLLRPALVVSSVASLALFVGCGGDDGGGDGGATVGATSTATAGDDGDGADDGVDDGADDGVTSTAGDGMDDTLPDSTGDDDADATDSETGPAGDVSVFRFASLNVRDPHFFGDTLVGCIDVTDSVPVGSSVNEQFNEAINTDMSPDGAPDGLLDLSLLLVFDPLDQADGSGGTLSFANGACPVGGGDCSLLPMTMEFPTDFTSSAAGPCDHVEAGDLSGYDPAPGTTAGPCFSAGPASVSIVTTSFTLPLEMTEIAATYQGDPATSLLSGTLRGFLSTANAEAVALPADLTESTGATNVAGLLPGHPTNCGNGDDTDGDGWWFYADFTALSAGYTG